MIESPKALEQLLAVFQRLGIEFMVGGSVASSIAGIWRATQDIDIVANIRLDHVESLEVALVPDFYADAGAMRDAIKRGRAFNVISFQSSQKFDIFPVLPDAYYETEFARRTNMELRLSGGRSIVLPTTTPEDIILAKLVWYRDGGGVSERQLHDIQCVLSVQKDRLDKDYMRQWAEHLGVLDLLDRVLAT